MILFNTSPTVSVDRFAFRRSQTEVLLSKDINFLSLLPESTYSQSVLVNLAKLSVLKLA